MLFGRRKHAVPSTRIARAPARSSAPAALDQTTKTGPTVEDFLRQHLTDRVVIALLYEETITVEHVRQAWQEWERRSDTKRPPLWRVLAEQPGVDVAAIRATAARAYGFSHAEVSPYATLAFIEMHASQFTSAQWERMIELCVLPVAQRAAMTPAGANRWVFATYDPIRPEVRQFLEQLKQDRFELVYAPEEMLVDLFTHLFAPEDTGLQELEALERSLQLPQDEEPVASRPAPASSRISFSEFFEQLLVTAVAYPDDELRIRENDQGWATVALEAAATGVSAYESVRVRQEQLVHYVQDYVLEGALRDLESGRSADLQRWLEDGLQHFQLRIEPRKDEASGKKKWDLLIRAVKLVAE